MTSPESRPLLDEFREYVGFGEADAMVLAALGPRLSPGFAAIIDAFYDAIEHSEAASVITGGPEQVQRLKGTLVDWLGGIFGGVYDEAYYERRARIGRVHVRIGLDQRYMFFAMDGVRTRLLSAVHDLELPPGDETAAQLAIDRICDLELAIMLETYREAYVERIRSAERFATLGQLAASIGHDLRNPLAVIETSVHLLKRPTSDDEKMSRHVARIDSQISVANGIITDLLELARDRELVVKTVALRSLLDDAVESMPKREQVRLRVEAPALPIRVDVDPAQLSRVLVNLLVNAAQAVAAGSAGEGEVVLTARAEAGTLVITVEDEGVGIEEDVIGRLFEPLFTTRARGIGLGLSICRRIVEKHGGVIEATNRTPKGARFSVRLPGAVVGGEN